MEKRRIAFVIFLIVGNIALDLPIFYYLGIGTTLQFIAIFTSLSTAAFSILNAPKKPQPLLGIQLRARGGAYSKPFLVGFDAFIDNMGDAPAKDIKVTCKTSPQIIQLEEDGIYNIRLLAPKGRKEINVLTSIHEDQVSKQRIDFEITYSNIENKTQTQINESFEIRDLIKKMEDKIRIGPVNPFLEQPK